MIRTQIQITEAQMRRLRRRAREEGISLAEVIRQCIETVLAAEAPDRVKLYERATELVGRFADVKGAKDLSSAHDRYLDESYS